MMPARPAMPYRELIRRTRLQPCRTVVAAMKTAAVVITNPSWNSYTPNSSVEILSVAENRARTTWVICIGEDPPAA